MTRPGSEEPRTSLARNVLAVPGIVFLVLTAVAPLTGMADIAAFLAATAVLLLFAGGYAQVAKVVERTPTP